MLGSSRCRRHGFASRPGALPPEFTAHLSIVVQNKYWLELLDWVNTYLDELQLCLLLLRELVYIIILLSKKS